MAWPNSSYTNFIYEGCLGYEEMIERTDGKGWFCIGNYDNYKKPVMEAAIKRFREDHPDIEFELRAKAFDSAGRPVRKHFALWVNTNADLSEFWRIYDSAPLVIG